MTICFTCKEYQFQSRYSGHSLSVYVPSFGFACFGICRNENSKHFNSEVHEDFTCDKHIEKEMSE